MQRKNWLNSAIKFTDKDFPQLQQITTPMIKKEWIPIKNTVVLVSNKYDIFKGQCDNNGVPNYGKISFGNGDTYHGPIFTSFPKNDEEFTVGNDDYNDYDEDCEEYEEDEYFDYEQFTYEQDPYENYGEMIYKDGRSFRGVFCFGKSVIKNLKITA
jgi:hypothetical protein